MSDALKNLDMLAIVAKGLGELLNEVVFVGGATVGLYIDDAGAREPAPSEDIDCVVEIGARRSYASLEKELRAKGFRDAASLGHENAPICRKIYRNIVVDVMPDDPKVLGFSNRWYSAGIKTAMRVKIPGHEAVEIAIFTVPYFTASKLEALKSRGGNDLRQSQDLEDLASLIDGRTTYLEEIRAAPRDVRDAIREEFQVLLKDPGALRESFEGFLRDAARAERAVRIITEISKS